MGGLGGPPHAKHFFASASFRVPSAAPLLTSSPMLTTTTTTRSGSRGLLRPAACCLGALGALALVYAAPAEAPSLFSRLKDRMKERYDANHILDERAPGMTCRDPDGPLMSGINSAVEWAVAKVPESRLHSLPVEAKLRVGLVRPETPGDAHRSSRDAF